VPEQVALVGVVTGVDDVGLHQQPADGERAPELVKVDEASGCLGG